MTARTFPKSVHLRTPAEFARVYKLRCVDRQRNLTVFAAPNDRDITRLGLSVSKKQGSAVVRNRLKRLLREAFRLERDTLPTGIDLVLIPQEAGDMKLAEFQTALVRAATRLKRRLSQPEGMPVRRAVDTAP